MTGAPATAPAAADADPRIAELLGALEALLAAIAPLRRRAADLRAGLAQAVRDYDRALRAANDEAAALRARQAYLRAQLAWVPNDTPAPRSGPAPVQPFGPQPDGPAAPVVPPPLAAADPRTERKRALADHVLYCVSFADAAEEDVVRQRINAVLNDPAADLGDMLEALAWGPVWQARQDWETPDQQLARLAEWRAALDARLAHWQREVAALERSDQLHLLEARHTHTPEEWEAYLAELAGEQRAENARLAHAVATLERQWAARQAAPGAADA